jgi:CIC family chloride channel protein
MPAASGRMRPGRETMSGYYAFRWVWIALLIGVVAGLGAILFDLTIDVITGLALHDVADTRAPTPRGESEVPVDAIVREIGHPALLPLVLASGGLISGLLVSKLSPEAAGGGNDSVIAAYHYQAGQVRVRVPFVKLIASAVTIGTGGSAGREGPSAQISAGFGSLIGQLLGFSPAERRLCLLIGMGAGIGAIFRAPLGGALLASELLYREDIEADALIPALVSSIAGYSVFSTYGGWDPLFGAQTHIVFNNPAELLNFAVLGALAGLVGLLFVRVYHRSERLLQGFRLALPVKTTLAGLLVGVIGMLVPETLETGYGWVQMAIDGEMTEMALWVLLLLPFLKILTTSLTVGSGMSGGLFGPGVFIGAMLGAGYWRAFHDTVPGMPSEPASMTIIAMIALLGAVAHVPLAAMLMVAEMTRNLSLLAPAMIALGIASSIVGTETLFRSQVPGKSDSPVHRHRYAFPLLSSLIANDALQPARIILHSLQTVAEAEDRLHAEGLTGAPVVGEEQQLVGVLTASDIAKRPESERPGISVSDLMSEPRVLLDQRTTLDVVFDSLVTEGFDWIPIVDSGGDARQRLLGIVSFQSILGAYRQALQRNVRRTDAMMVGSTLLEVRVTSESPLCRLAVRDLELPEDALLVSYTRNQVVRFPHGDTVFEPGDIVGVVTSIAAETRIHRFLEDEMRVEPI